MKFLSILLIILVVSGCSEKEIIIKTVEVLVPIECIVPTVECNTTSDNPVEVLGNMISCIYKYREAIKVCQ